MKCTQASLLFSFMLSLIGQLSAITTGQLSANATDITLATFNIRRAGSEDAEKPERLWDARKDSVVQVIKDLNADVLGLQEVTEIQLQYLQKHLTDYACVGEGRGKAFFGISKSEWTPIFYKKDRYDIIHYTTFWLNGKGGRFWINESSKGKLPRICTMAVLQDKKTRKKFVVFNTHLDNEYPLARINQAQEIIKKSGSYHTLIGEFKEPLNVAEFSRIIMGDFNVEWLPDIKQIASDPQRQKEIVNECGGQVTLATKFINAGFENTRSQVTKSTPKKEETMRNEWKSSQTGFMAVLKQWFGKSKAHHETSKTIDHILVTKGIQVTSHEHVYIDLDTVSDHRPVKVVVTI